MKLIIADTIIALCLLVLFTSILINFSESGAREVKHEKKSPVETGTMTLFFVGFYLIIKFKVGGIVVGAELGNIFMVIGLLMIVVGCVLNVIGRFNLGKNWANQVKIYDDQIFIKTGLYGIVRHPLYASLMLMFYGACLVYPNYVAFLANTVVFIPFMYLRAKQEESLLLKSFKSYSQYQKDIGMFFPKIKKL